MSRGLPRQRKLAEKQPAPCIAFYSVVPTSSSGEGIPMEFTCQGAGIPAALGPVIHRITESLWVI